jgi:hypothetical protein
MSTRSRIAMATESGFRSIYCHGDGHPEYNGRLLLEHYTTPAKVRRLIALGDISCLGEEIGRKHPFSRPWHDDEALDAYEAEYSRMTLAYGRDRGETGVDPIDDPSFGSLARTAANCDAVWLYLWIDGVWNYAAVEADMVTSDLKPLRHIDVNPEPSKAK